MELNCPICNSDKIESVINLDCGNLDNSPLYRVAKISLCKGCGHVYNRLSPEEIVDLTKYYNEEYAPTNISSTDKTGDRPGSNNRNTLERYGRLFDIISPHVHEGFRILDAGCAMGGFLEYLDKKGFRKLFGVELSENYVNYAKENTPYNIKLGNAESIPFEDNKFDLVIMDQLLEHLVEPRKAFQEAKRVLDDGGLLCVGAPDALRYDKNYFFDFYWFLLREHVQHFDVAHMKILAESEGFELISFSHDETPIVSEKMILPTFNALFRLTGKINNEMTITKKYLIWNLENEIKEYVANNLKRMNESKEIIEYLAKSKEPIYVWGIGREFLYLYETAGLKDCNLVGLIDSSKYKQDNFTVDGVRMCDKSVLCSASSNSKLLITAKAYVDSIMLSLGELGYCGNAIEI